MRCSLLCIVFTALLACVAAWTKEDHEIFRLRDELELNEGAGVTFYEYVGVSPSASQKEIQNAYRKKSAQLHPDKAERNFVAARLAEKSKGVDGNAKPKVNTKPSRKEIQRAIKEAQGKYQRLSVIKEVLTGESRTRYDHFLKNGFPQWRSTGYYYQRFRPGLGSVLIGLWVFAGGAVHYGILIMNYNQRKAFSYRTIKKARKDALGYESSINTIPGLETTEEPAAAPAVAPAESEEGVPEPRNRKERRYMEKMQAKENKNGKAPSKKKTAAKPAAAAASQATAATSTPKKRVLSSNGKVLLVANDGQVYLQEEDEDGNVEEHLLDPESMEKPTFSQTALVRAPFWIADFVQSKISGKTE